MKESWLRRDAARLLQREREAAGLSHAELAARSGVSVSNLTRIERQTLAPSLETVEKIFAALGLQARLTTEPVDDLEAQIDQLAWLPLATRLERSGVGDLLRTLDSLPYVIDGGVAATLQGVPLPIEALELDVAWDAAGPFTGWLVRRLAYRWYEAKQEFRLLDLDPRAPGPHYWQTSLGKVRARMVEELPVSIEIKVGERVYRVRPLADVETDDPVTARVLLRYREREAA
jgi:transcriptional regulator with XRE-family HTH domain